MNTKKKIYKTYFNDYIRQFNLIYRPFKKY